MEITWYGHSCFRLAERGTATVVTDPSTPQLTGSKLLNLTADIVTISQGDPDQDYGKTTGGKPYIITGPGEYEVGGVFITAIHMEGQKNEGNNTHDQSYTLYSFNFDPMTIVHLGNLHRVLTQAEVEVIGSVNIAIVPVDEHRGMNAARVAEVISMLEPNIVIPIYNDLADGSRPESLTKFLKEMGLNEITPQPVLKIANSSLPEETQVIVLEHQRG